MNEKVSLAAKLALIDDQWRPRIVAAYNENKVVLVKVQGDFVWHKHDDTDDLFLVISGRLLVDLRDRTVELGPGELFVVPEGRRASTARAAGDRGAADRADGHAQHRGRRFRPHRARGVDLGGRRAHRNGRSRVSSRS